MVLASDFLEFVEALDANSVEFLIVGGYAVNYHGHVRSTGALDVFVRCTLENAKRHLRQNKLASRRLKDLADVESLPDPES